MKALAHAVTTSLLYLVTHQPPLFVVWGCLKWPEIFSVIASRASGASFNTFLPLSNSTCMWKNHTPSPVYIKEEEREAKHCLFICQVPWQRTELTREGFPPWSQGALFPILTCPVYAQRLMLFANHTLWNSPKRSETCRAAGLSAAFTTASYIANSVRFWRMQPSPSICPAVTFSGTVDLCLHSGSPISLIGLSSPRWTDP